MLHLTKGGRAERATEPLVLRETSDTSYINLQKSFFDFKLKIFRLIIKLDVFELWVL